MPFFSFSPWERQSRGRRSIGSDRTTFRRKDAGISDDVFAVRIASNSAASVWMSQMAIQRNAAGRALGERDDHSAGQAAPSEAGDSVDDRGSKSLTQVDSAPGHEHRPGDDSESSLESRTKDQSLARSASSTPLGGPEEIDGTEEASGEEQAQEQEDQQIIQELKARDREVRAHEQAHAAVGGQYAGSPSYSYETGPDGQRYAVGGEVQIDISPVAGDPRATIEKMRVVQAAAMAPAEPSAQDRAVAAQAQQTAAQAEAELNAQRGEELSKNQSGDENEDGVASRVASAGDSSPDISANPSIEDSKMQSMVGEALRPKGETSDLSALRMRHASNRYRQNQIAAPLEIQSDRATSDAAKRSDDRRRISEQIQAPLGRVAVEPSLLAEALVA